MTPTGDVGEGASEQLERRCQFALHSVGEFLIRQSGADREVPKP
jgi:hypothetical protein